MVYLFMAGIVVNVGVAVTTILKEFIKQMKLKYLKNKMKKIQAKLKSQETHAHRFHSGI